MAAGKRLVEVADVGLGAAEDGRGVVVGCVGALVAGDDDRGVERLDLLDARDPPHALVVVGKSQPRAEDRVQAEEVIGLAVGDVDRREVLSGSADPVYDPAGVLGGEGGVDQYRVTLATDQRDRSSRPVRLALAHRGISPTIGLYG